ncbi:MULTISPECIES: GntR family transcriptional regulator [Clostridia]|uniref:GntR family transcriptional regulator n=1 Tax=Clostridia TaxID=186801 RepID=UPI000EA030FA|nr:MULTISPECIES: GntR family transcriptional regulator [Clostridia]NBJ70291.1 GntR family transcriptional regulator [Roseburia sp. 1XD42-34]RKI76430.1 GntR family transcriptional regulator [Clostridium sp. 1xD42-85]
MQILISNSSKEAIYQQIKNQIKEKVMAGELQEGYALPSMRQLAKDLHISVITTKRAYEELEKEGFIYSIMGKGSFIAEQNPDIIKEKKLATIEEKLVEVIVNSKELGLSLHDIKEWMTILYEER